MLPLHHPPQQQQQQSSLQQQLQGTMTSITGNGHNGYSGHNGHNYNHSHHGQQQSQSQPPQMMMGMQAPTGMSVLMPMAACAPRFSDQQWELSEEIARYARGLVHTMEQKSVLFNVMIGRVAEVVSRVLPGAEIFPYGSFMTGLCIPTSDLDLVCCIGGGGPDGLQLAFRTLTEALRGKSWLESIKAIETSKVPVIKVVSKKEHISTDISFTSYSYNWSLSHYGLQSVRLVNSFLCETPKLLPLTLILKEFLYEKGLNMPFNGGLSSYCLTIMIKTFLTIHDRTGTKSTGEALVDFLRYYGLEFDYATTGISTLRGGVHYRLGAPYHCSGFGAAFVIEDPFNATNNISAGTFCITQIKAAFAEAYRQLAIPSPPSPGVPVVTHPQSPSSPLRTKGESSPIPVPSVSALASSPFAASISSPSVFFSQNQRLMTRQQVDHTSSEGGEGDGGGGSNSNNSNNNNNGNNGSNCGNGTTKYKILPKILTKYLN